MQTNTNLFFKRCVAIFLLLCQSSIGWAQVANTSLCVSAGYTVGFFNGVGNTPAQAADAVTALRNLTGRSFNSETVKYEAFYNVTGSAIGATVLQDLAEVFIQRAEEIDASGELGNRWEFFWESLRGEKTFTERVIGFLPSSLLLFKQLDAAISSKLMAGLSFLLSNPSTEVNYAFHKFQLNELALQKQKVILVAHSQGNLFANRAYDYIVPTIGISNVQVVHIAPASPTLRGNYVLAFIDVVINGLRIQGKTSVPTSNITVDDLPVSKSDLSGHALIDTYLDGSRGGRARVNSMINTAMQKMIPTTGSSVGNECAPNVSFTTSTAPNVDSPVTFTPIITNFTGSKIISYQWDFGDGSTIPITATVNGALASQIHTYSSAGNYSSTLTVTNSTGENFSATVTVVVNKTPPASTEPTTTEPTTTEQVSMLYRLGTANSGDGSFPIGIAQGSNGNLYVTTSRGGTNNQGTVLKINPVTGFGTSIFSFSNGSEFDASVNQGNDGMLYGTTRLGGMFQKGTVFRINPVTGLHTLLYSFNTDQVKEAQPTTSPIQGSDGFLYGTSGMTVYKINPTTGARTVLYVFGKNVTQGFSLPEFGVIQGVDGNLYGTTSTSHTVGGSRGTVFKIDPRTSVKTVLHTFGAIAGDFSPQSGLFQGSDGFLYGLSGTTIYKINPDTGARTLIKTFNAGLGDGTPTFGVVQGNDGNLYGTTDYGGLYNSGTIYKIDPETGVWTFTHSFALYHAATSALIKGNDGNLYGTNNLGVFKIVP